MKFTEAQVESAIIELLGAEGYPHVLGEAIERSPQEVLIKADLWAFLAKRYAGDAITAELKVDLIILLAENGYPPVDRDEVYKEIFEQAENFKKYQGRV